MKNLPLHKKVHIINQLVEGNSLRTTSRIVGASINTVTNLLVSVGSACEKYHFENMVNVPARKIQCDEIWSFVYAKKKNLPKNKDGGDVWTWVGIDADTKLVVSWAVGNKDLPTATYFITA